MFDWSRFRRLAAAHWAEQRKAYAWFIGVGMILHIVLLIISLSGKNGFMSLSTDGQAAMYFVGMFSLAPIFAGRYFQQMARRQSALLVLMRPASVFEKWLLAVLVVVLAYPLAYSVAFYSLNIPAWLVAHAQAQQFFIDEAARIKLAGPEAGYDLGRLTISSFQLFLPSSRQLTWSGILLNIVALSSLQAFAIFGSLYFRSAPFIKTLFAAFLMLLAMILVGTVFEANSELVFGYWHSDRPMSGFQRALFPLLWIAIPLLLWLSTFLALKEREIAP